MSYDLYFMPHDWPSERIGDVMQGKVPGPVDAELWERVLAQAREVLGEVRVAGIPPYWQVDHLPSGISLEYGEGQWTLTVPYWSHGAEARGVAEKLRALALIVERETGLKCYDIQIDAPFVRSTEGGVSGPAEVFDEVADHLGRR